MAYFQHALPSVRSMNLFHFSHKNLSFDSYNSVRNHRHIGQQNYTSKVAVGYGEHYADRNLHSRQVPSGPDWELPASAGSAGCPPVWRRSGKTARTRRPAHRAPAGKTEGV